MNSWFDWAAENQFDALSQDIQTFINESQLDPTETQHRLADMINRTNAQGWSCLHFAARFGHGRICSLLLQHGADTRLKSADGKTAFDLALKFNNLECTKLLQQRTITTTRPVFKDPPMFFAGSYLDRQASLDSHLRGKLSLLEAFKTPSSFLQSSQILVFHQNNVLVKSTASQLRLDVLTPSALLESTSKLYAVRDIDLKEVFLGVDPLSGSPYFALEVSSSPQLVQGKFNLVHEFLVLEKRGKFDSSRNALLKLNDEESALVSQAKALVDWNFRMKFCPGCGSETVTMDSGWKKMCSNSSCASKSEVQNYSFPRTDAVVITMIVSPKTNKCLLGRKSFWAPQLYSCIAGFVEPGETLEEACRREAKEETGVDVGKVTYLSSQPWPFPSQLMLGCIAEAISDEVTLIDDELQDAQWFEREEVLLALKNESTKLKLPPRYAIAHILLEHWAKGATTGSKI